MSYRNLSIILFTVFLLTGCAPKASFNYSLKNMKNHSIPHDQGHIVFSDFDVPQKEARVISLIGGRAVTQSVTVFDITDQLTYIATLTIDYHLMYQSYQSYHFAEVDLPVGKRTLMLINSGIGSMNGNGQTDFIEINVANDHTTHIAISAYPDYAQKDILKSLIKDTYYTKLKFTELRGIPDEVYNYCSQNICEKCNGDNQKTISFLKNGGIKENNPFFNTYSQMLSDRYKYVISLNQESFTEFEKYKNQIQKQKEKDFPAWNQSTDKNRIFFMPPK